MFRKFFGKNLESGNTMVEVLTVTAITGILLAAGISNLRVLENPLNDAAFSSIHYLKLARATALSRTKAVIITPSSTTLITAAEADSCTGTTTAISDLKLEMPSGAVLDSTGWAICFTQRGFADAATNFQINGSGNNKTIEVSLGGGVREQ